MPAAACQLCSCCLLLLHGRRVCVHDCFSPQSRHASQPYQTRPLNAHCSVGRADLHAAATACMGAAPDPGLSNGTGKQKHLEVDR